MVVEKYRNLSPFSHTVERECRTALTPVVALPTLSDRVGQSTAVGTR